MKPKIKYQDDNVVILKGDNIDVMKAINSNTINLIYSDILYNTGKKFEDYNDNLGSPKEAVEWYRPRLMEMKRLLTKNGSIYIHCNWRLVHYVKVLMDEIFGYDNFMSEIHRKCNEERGYIGNYDAVMDNVLFYVMDKDDYTFNHEQLETPKMIPLVEDGLVEGMGEKYFWNYESPYEPCKYISEWYVPKMNNRHWIVSEEKFNQLKDKHKILLIDGKPYLITHDKSISNLWDDCIDDYSRLNKTSSYDTPKPPSLLERIIKTSSNEGDVVADFFMGGGNIVVETVKLNRQGVFCDISEKACETAIKNLNNFYTKGLILD